MLKEWFINNGRMPLAAGIGATDTELTVTGGIAPNDIFSSSYFARATLSVEGGSAVEVVYITRLNPLNNTLTVIRGRERTSAQSWPAGAVLECRVTAGMLTLLSAGTLFNANAYGLSLADGDILKCINPEIRSQELVASAWAIGGSPVMPENGASDWVPISRSVEGVGTSVSVELGVPPDFNPAVTYYPGAVVRDPNPPHDMYSRSGRVILGQETLPLDTDLGDAWSNPWSKVAPDVDGGIQRVFLEAGYDDSDAWFYPSEIGFICDQHSATSTPIVSVGEVDEVGELVSLNSLVDSVPLSSIDGARQRMVLSSNLKKGVKGLIFSMDTAAVGGSFKGRFYWKGLFICSNSAAGWPTQPSSPDGLSS